MIKLNLDEVIKFIIIGIIGFGLELGILYVLTEKIGIFYLMSSQFSFIIGVCLNYILCKCFVFNKATKKTKNTFIIFVLSSSIGLIITQFLMKLLVNKIRLHYIFAKFIVALVVLVWNYVTKKHILT